MTPAEAAARVAAGAVLVDIRPAAQRAREGEVPGALVVERNVLEWRFDPASDARLPEATGYDVDVVVLCSEGYTSSLAADALRSLGLHRATDVIGGFAAWAAAGLPTIGGPLPLLIPGSTQPPPGRRPDVGTTVGAWTTTSGPASSIRRPRTASSSPGARRRARPSPASSPTSSGTTSSSSCGGRRRAPTGRRSWRRGGCGGSRPGAPICCAGCPH